MKNIRPNAPKSGTRDFISTRLNALESILRPGLTLAGMLKMVTAASGDTGRTLIIEHLGITDNDMNDIEIIDSIVSRFGFNSGDRSTTGIIRCNDVVISTSELAKRDSDARKRELNAYESNPSMRMPLSGFSKRVSVIW